MELSHSCWYLDALGRHSLVDAFYHSTYMVLCREGELTLVVLYVVVLESRGTCDRCDDLPVALTLLPVGPYVEVEGLLDV